MLKKTKKANLEASHYLTTNNIIWLQSPKQDGTGIKNRHIDQWNRIENPEIKPKNLTATDFDKANKNIKWGKDTIQQIVLG